jgi:hypothetical protein
MSYAISRDTNTAGYMAPAKNQSFISVFFQWSARQDADHHIAWAGISMLATTAVFFPLTMASIVLNGAAFPLIITAMVALVLVVVLNLAAMPTQYTIPAFVLGILIDAGVIIASLLMH